jgi:2-amino-4-hydroxy-6-hydroxymethyldihydropteridine diphosphokinase
LSTVVPIHAAVMLGSNLGARAANIAGAVIAIASIPGTRLLARSSVRESAAMIPPGETPPGAHAGVGAAAKPYIERGKQGGAYLNAAVLIATRLSARDLVGQLQRIEARFGRDRASETSRWLPRTLDLDLILFGDQVIEEPDLRVPHPGMHERLFVLEPLAEIAPAMHVPTRAGEAPRPGRTVLEMFESLRRLRAEAAEAGV